MKKLITGKTRFPKGHSQQVFHESYLPSISRHCCCFSVYSTEGKRFPTRRTGYEVWPAIWGALRTRASSTVSFERVTRVPCNLHSTCSNTFVDIANIRSFSKVPGPRCIYIRSSSVCFVFFFYSCHFIFHIFHIPIPRVYNSVIRYIPSQRSQKKNGRNFWNNLIWQVEARRKRKDMKFCYTTGISDEVREKA